MPNWTPLIFAILAAFLATPSRATEEDNPAVNIPKALEEADKFFTQGDFRAAEAELRLVLQEDPKNSRALKLWAELCARTDRFDKAEQAYRKLLAIQPEDYPTYLDLWEVVLKRKPTREDSPPPEKRIRAEMESLLSEHEPSDRLYWTAIQGFERIGDKDRRDALKDEFVRKFRSSPFWREVGEFFFERVLEKSSPADRAGPAEQFAKDFPKHPWASIAWRLVLGYLVREKKDPTTVRQYARRWVKSQPDNPQALAVSARSLLEMKIEPALARSWAEKAFRQIPEKPDLKNAPWLEEIQFTDAPRRFQLEDIIGHSYLLEDNLTKAAKHLKRAIELEPFYGPAHAHLGELQEKQKTLTFQEGIQAPVQTNLDEAIESYAQAMVCRDQPPEIAPRLPELLEERQGKEAAASPSKWYAKKHGIVRFEDVTSVVGLDGAGGGRVAWGDFNADGYPDLLVNGGALWKNTQGNSFEAAGCTGISGGHTGGVWADWNNDGHLDLFGFGGEGLYRNLGNGAFENVTDRTGGPRDEFPTEAAAWADFDRDGFLDIYLANYEKGMSQGTPDGLWKNEQGKSFREVTAESGANDPKPYCGRGAAWGDYNDDGLPDLLVANYRLEPNLLWRNLRDGTFRNDARESGTEGVERKGWYGHSIGADWGDFDNDGDLDLAIGNLAHPRYIEISNMTQILVNSGPSDYLFTDKRKALGIRYEETHSDVAWGDYDNDGYLDLYLTGVYAERPSFLYWSKAAKRFEDVTWASGTRVMDGWGCAWADYDRDGDLDLAVCSGGKVRLLENQLYVREEPRKTTRKDLVTPRWLELQLVGTHCNRAAIGARAEIRLGKSIHLREVQGGRGTGCQNDLVLHFGLGDSPRQVRVEIRWPCGRRHTKKVRVNQLVRIEE